MQFTAIGFSDIHIEIFNNNDTEKKSRVPDSLFKRPSTFSWGNLNNAGLAISQKQFYFSVKQPDPVHEVETNIDIISTDSRKFYISDKFSEIGFILPTRKCFGLG